MVEAQHSTASPAARETLFVAYVVQNSAGAGDAFCCSGSRAAATQAVPTLQTKEVGQLGIKLNTQS